MRSASPQACLFGSNSRFSVWPHSALVQVSVRCCTPKVPQSGSAPEAVTFIGSPQSGQASAAGAFGRPSRAATRSSNSFTRFGRPMTAFQPGT